jgi:hypothetical protein
MEQTCLLCGRRPLDRARRCIRLAIINYPFVSNSNLQVDEKTDTHNINILFARKRLLQRGIPREDDSLSIMWSQREASSSVLLWHHHLMARVSIYTQ